MFGNPRPFPRTTPKLAPFAKVSFIIPSSSLPSISPALLARTSTVEDETKPKVKMHNYPWKNNTNSKPLLRHGTWWQLRRKHYLFSRTQLSAKPAWFPRWSIPVTSLTSLLLLFVAEKYPGAFQSLVKIREKCFCFQVSLRMRWVNGFSSVYQSTVQNKYQSSSGNELVAFVSSWLFFSVCSPSVFIGHWSCATCVLFLVFSNFFACAQQPASRLQRSVVNGIVLLVYSPPPPPPPSFLLLSNPPPPPGTAPG